MEAVVLAIVRALGGKALQARRIRKHAASGYVDVALKPVGSRRWEHGRAKVSTGLLRFRRTAHGLGFQLFVQERPERLISVGGVGSAQRSPTIRESWSVNSEMVITRLVTASGELDVALMKRDAAHVLEVLDPRPAQPQRRW